MRKIEAEWLRDRLENLRAEDLSPVLEIGSSSQSFRTYEKPHIEELVHAPLRNRDVRIVTADIRDEEGVEIVGDVFDPDTQIKLKEVGAKTLLLCNLLEHLTDPHEFTKVCLTFVEPGGKVVVTVPHDYPYHLDPIDTMFRPGIEEIHALFPSTEIVDSAILIDGGRWSDLLARHKSAPNAVVAIILDIARMITLRGGIERAKSRLSGLRFLFKNYKVAAVVLKVQDAPVQES